MYESKEILKNQFKKLPKDIQDAILAVDLRSKMQFITKKNNLHIDQAETLENEAVFVMLGLEHPGNLVANIAKHVEVSEEKAEVIAEDLNREIFLKVRESLKKIFEKRDAEESSLPEEGNEGGGSLLAGSLLGKREEKETDETLKRENILREIEDKEHHNLPTVNKQELHLETPFPSEISEQVSFQNQKMADNIKREEPAEMIVIRPEQPQRQPAVPQAEAMKTMKGDIFKNKMSGTMNVPKETIEINYAEPPAKAKRPNIGGEFDPYREKVQ